ncbi:MAG: dTDP-4-dehydrorhamnose 3,5-epimerase [Beijerinckiaceae bacterium]|jgi:dTDP-4-dehydrorhamnose 3,5-epimerase|nr:dTDP-4-dehydrorhamnose 3,5-epimerase [Beijerinckiaceae bacterium]
MKFERIGGSDARLIRFAQMRDERGSFARVWCADTFRHEGIDFTPAQANTSSTLQRGSLRGMHYQRAPREDAKIVRCSLGRIHDVIVDLRETSPTRGRWFAQDLSDENGLGLYIPGGFAHGFQTLTDHVVVEYLMGESYVPELYDGFRHDDASIGIEWPLPVASMSDKDRAWPDLLPRLPWLGAAGAKS